MGYIQRGENGTQHQSNTVYDENGIARTLSACDYKSPMMIMSNTEPIIVASRGRNPENPNSRIPGEHTEQRLEPNKEGIANTLTTVQKDNYVAEPQLEYIGSISDKDIAHDGKDLSRNSPQGYRVYSDNGISVTLAANGGGKGGTSGLYMTDSVDNYIEEANKFAKHQQDLLQSDEGVCRAIPAGTHGSTPHLLKTVINNNPYKIRKLTPLECWRLMGFTDENYKKAAEVNSNTQLYKQAGNSIVVNVLMAIFKELLK